jgi:lipopolysaccharide transport system permease protein
MMNMRISRQQLPIWVSFNPLRAILGIWQCWDLLWQLVWRNIQARYKGTIIGLVWIVITPLIMLAVYTFVFSVVFKARWGADFGDSKIAFALILFCGLAVFNIFAESVTGSTGVITGNPNYVKKVVFPLEILPVSIVLSAFFLGLVSLTILLAGVGLFIHKFSLAIICLPLVFVPLFLLCCGISWFVASLGVYVRDLPHAVGIVIQVLFFMTPIIYSIEMVPQQIKPILFFNPLTTIIQTTRHILIYNKWPKWSGLATVTLLSLVIFQLGYVWFMKTKRGFADVL